MRVMIKNIEGRCEVLLVEKASIALSNGQLRLTLLNNPGIIFVYTGTNSTAHKKLAELLENGWADLSDYYAEPTCPAE